MTAPEPLSEGIGRAPLHGSSSTTFRLGRLSYCGNWGDLFDARFVSGADAPILNGRPIIDFEVTGVSI